MQGCHGRPCAPRLPLQRWLDKVGERPGVQAGVKVPTDLQALRKGDGEGAKKLVESARTIVQR